METINFSIKVLEIQGDVALRVVNTLPENAYRTERQPLALGEVSGHAHVVESHGVTRDNYELFFDADSRRTFLAVGSDGAQLRHIKIETRQQAEHDPLKLEPNTLYEVILQNEFNHEAEAFERVQD